MKKIKDGLLLGILLTIIALGACACLLIIAAPVLVAMALDAGIWGMAVAIFLTVFMMLMLVGVAASLTS